MTTCRECRDRLSPYLEGELEGDELSRLEGHLDGCAACRAELELLRLTVESLRGLPDLPAPAGILAGVREGMAPPPWHRRLVGALTGPGWRRLPLGAFATLLVAFGVFTLTERFPEFGRPPGVTSPAPAPLVEPVVPPAEEVQAEADGDDAFIAPSEPEASAPVATEEKVTAFAVGDKEDRERLKAAKAPAEGLATLPLRDGPAVTIQGKGEAITGPSYRSTQGLADTSAEISARGQVGTAALPEAGKRLAFTAGSKKEVSRDLGATARAKRKRAAPARSPLAPAIKAARESMSFRQEDEAAAIASFGDDRGDYLSMGMEEKPVDRPEDIETFTIVSFSEDEMGELRQSLKEAGGHLLEMKTIDAHASQQMAMPYQSRIPLSQTISRGWQIRATVPRDNIESFVDSLSDRQALQILHRAQAPADWDADPGSQKIEINLIR